MNIENNNKKVCLPMEKHWQVWALLKPSSPHELCQRRYSQTLRYSLKSEMKSRIMIKIKVLRMERAF